MPLCPAAVTLFFLTGRPARFVSKQDKGNQEDERLLESTGIAGNCLTRATGPL